MIGKVLKKKTKRMNTLLDHATPEDAILLIRSSVKGLIRCYIHKQLGDIEDTVMRNKIEEHLPSCYKRAENKMQSSEEKNDSRERATTCT